MFGFLRDPVDEINLSIVGEAQPSMQGAVEIWHWLVESGEKGLAEVAECVISYLTIPPERSKQLAATRNDKQVLTMRPYWADQSS